MVNTPDELNRAAEEMAALTANQRAHLLVIILARWPDHVRQAIAIVRELTPDE